MRKRKTLSQLAVNLQINVLKLKTGLRAATSLKFDQNNLQPLNISEHRIPIKYLPFNSPLREARHSGLYSGTRQI